MNLFRQIHLIFFYCLFAFVTVIAGCKSYDEEEDALTDTPGRGTINISADESFKPIVDELVKVYESNNPGTTIRVQYKPEAECLKDLKVDSVRMVIATRRFNSEEENYIIDSMKTAPSSIVVARDAVAVIVHPQAKDSLFTMNELKEILTGKFRTKLTPVFDGVQATSTVRFIVDSVLKTESLTPDARAARTSEGVIDYISKDPQAIGFIGVSWIGNREDTTQTSFLKKVKMVQVESTDAPGRFVLPVQYNIYYKRYPMVRDLVYILKERHRGLGTGFADFLGGVQGQLIFKRAYLMPVQNNFIVRPVRLRD
jgi:phosphate transport system substrate-binding protein